ncbi:nucleotidyltransferase domain-containing protein [Urbifossiella limnaea]|uniref:Putative nucleotidyltransferase n=1 Tax=Urbifossiella limnaea TaxID=2528023 RepID=A0A517XTK5_9BACT|nr:nucleotidyltransferase domain-containing protein [Urbifossiella limnaea]QDU20831.1 putative nucleotidyltransferase [Urbifossiella limnaea]
MADVVHNLDLPALGRWGTSRIPDALFLTVSGAHLYGFPSADSDIDLRGAFLAPLRRVVGLRRPVETVEPKGEFDGLETEAVAHEIGKYLRLLAKDNGYVLEQVFSPLVAHGADFLARLRPVAARCVTRGCHHHYRGFLQTQLRMLDKQNEVRAKTLLYAYRVVLTGIHLLETGEVQAHLPTLNERFGLDYIPELIRRKSAAEVGTLPGEDVTFHRAELARWEARLDAAHATGQLPDAAPADAVDEFLVNLRLGASQAEQT